MLTIRTGGIEISFTRGGDNKRKRFDWYFDSDSQCLNIKNENGREHVFPVSEIDAILGSILDHFGGDYFPLANNVEKLSNGTEQLGLGSIIFAIEGSTTAHAQGASYLGVVLEECGFLTWNRKHRGIEWRLTSSNHNLETLVNRLASLNRKK